jgi:CubicO group peptidase (beta-lactamase class C family)
MKSIVLGFVTVALLAVPFAANAKDSLNDQLEPIRAKYGLPVLAAAVVKDGKIVASGAVGVRVYGTHIPVKIGDRFHIGSDTKAMTATLAGMMIEEGKLRWDSTIGEVLGPVIPNLKPKFAAITLEQLLSHTSGIPSDNEEITKLYFSPDAYDYTLTDYRLRMISEWGTKHEPSFPSDTKFQYANFGYVIAGAMIEKVAGEPWDHLIITRIFEPLGLKSAGLGPQATFGKYDAPVGHDVDAKGKITPRPWGPSADGPAVVGPAGIVHMNVEDFATWAGWNAGEGKRGPSLVKPETLKRLHQPHVVTSIPDPKPGTPKSGSYALGWGLMKFNWSDKPLLTHTGSNSLNLASILVDTGNDAGIVVMTNFPGKKADAALLETTKALYLRYVKDVTLKPSSK